MVYCRMISLHTLLEQHWQQPKPWLLPLLWPLSRLFQAAAAVRVALYAAGWLKQTRLPVPLVVVGNVHAGGVGKTPVTAALAQALTAAGVAVGIISRGYGRRARHTVVLDAHSTVAEAGDEPLMLYRQSGVPVAVAARRADAARALLAAHPHIRLLLADDGLQHYALARDMELVVFPAAAVGRPQDVLPNGGLREPLSRLHNADALLFSNAPPHFDSAAAARAVGLPENAAAYAVPWSYGMPYRLKHPRETAPLAVLAARGRVAALAAIARPQRFFDALAALGVTLAECRALPDHGAIAPSMLPAADVVLVTEKDAVKLAAYDLPQVWVLPVCAIIPPVLVQRIISLLPENPVPPPARCGGLPDHSKAVES